MIPTLQRNLINIENGIATLSKMCWGCGEIHEIPIPLDDVGTETESARMCQNCIDLFCGDE